MRLNSPQLKTVSFADHAPLGPHGDSPETNPAIKTDNDKITVKSDSGLRTQSRVHARLFCAQKYFRRVTDSPARYRMNRRAALPAPKPRTRRRRSMFNVNIQMEKYKYENQNKHQSGVAHSSASAARPEIITARNSKAGAVSGFCFDASAPVRTPRMCGDVAPAAGSIRLQVRRPLITDNRRRAGSRLDTCLHLQAASHRLVVL